MMAGFRVQLMFFLLSIFVSAWGISSSQPADDYYSTIDFSATDDELKTQLQVLINEHYVYNYTDGSCNIFVLFSVHSGACPFRSSFFFFLSSTFSSLCYVDPDGVSYSILCLFFSFFIQKQFGQHLPR